MYIKTIINQLFFLYVKNIKYFFSHICSKKIRKEVFFMKPEPIDLQNIGKVYHNENEAVCNEENYEDETKEENLCCRQVKRGEVYFADYYYDNGILADKRRPAVIVSNHGINEKAPFVKSCLSYNSSKIKSSCSY